MVIKLSLTLHQYSGWSYRLFDCVTENCHTNKWKIIVPYEMFFLASSLHKEDIGNRILFTSADNFFFLSWNLLNASDWSTNRESYMGVQNRSSVDIKRPTFGFQMCWEIHAWERKHSSHTQTCCQNKRS